MSAYAQSRPTIVEMLWPVSGRDTALVRSLAVIVLGNLLMIASAKVQIPMYPVPMTMQTFAATIIGLTAGWRLGGAAVLAYLVEGALGLPVFASGAGLAYMAGPTGGYLLGFLAAAAIAGLAVQYLGMAGVIFGTIASTAVIFAFGVTWLATLIGWDAAIANGLLPFLIGAALKIGLAIGIAYGLVRAADGRQG